MRFFNILALFLLVITGCHAQQVETVGRASSNPSTEYKSFGAGIEAENAITEKELLKKYKKLQVADTINTKVKATVTGVCQVKGCWMQLRPKKTYGFEADGVLLKKK